MQVTNKSRSPLGIPGVGMLEPGASKDVPDSITGNAVIAAWIKAGMLVEDGEPAKPAGHEQTDEDSNVERSGDEDEKDALIAKLAEHGIEKTRRSSVRTLREALAEVNGG